MRQDLLVRRCAPSRAKSLSRRSNFRGPGSLVASLFLALALLFVGVTCVPARPLAYAWAKLGGLRIALPCANCSTRTASGTSRTSVAQPQVTQVASTSGYTFTAIDVPAAGTSLMQGTIGIGINAGGDVTGVYLTTPNVAHGFVRSAATGTITTFDVPNAGVNLNQGTFPIKIELAGNITGMYIDSNNAYHGFVRSATGTITEFDVTGAPTTLGHRGTVPLSINAALQITGFYIDANAVRHGFLRAADGTFTSFDDPGAGTSALQGTVPIRINGAGGAVGVFIDANQVFHGFLRNSKATFSSAINAPNASTVAGKGIKFGGTLAHSIDGIGDIAGIYTDASSVFHGFFVDPSGVFTSIDAPGAVAAGVFPGTAPTDMDAGGDIAGTFSDAGGVNHGFVRLFATSAFTSPIDAPGAGSSVMFSGTIPFAVNLLGELAGAYVDSKGVFHGFLAVAPAVATPTFSPAAGSFTSAQSVTISDTTAGAAIFFTTDGSDPTSSPTAIQFTAPITVSATETIKAIAGANGLSNSAVASATYTIGTAPPPAAAMPTFAPAPGTYTSAQNVTLSDTTTGASIFFTTDGTTPSATSSAKFTTAIAVSATETIKAIATAPGFSTSALASGTYTINPPAPDFQISVNPTTLTIRAGQSGTAKFTVTPQNGFNSQVTFACSGLPSEANCAFNPPSVAPNGAAVSSTLTLSTTAPSAALRGPWSPRSLYMVLLAVWCVAFAFIFGFRRKLLPIRRWPVFVSVALLCMASCALVSCGGASTPTNPGTPQGTSAVVVSASAGGTSHSANLTVTIAP